MVDTTEKIENSELVTNRDQFAILCLYYYICHIYINYQNHNL
jgi:hypothetical protein